MWFFTGHNVLDFRDVWFNSSDRNRVSEKLYLAHSKNTFRYINDEFVCVESLENLAEMFYMFFIVIEVNYYVIDIIIDKIKVAKCFVEKMLKSLSSVT